MNHCTLYYVTFFASVVVVSTCSPITFIQRMTAHAATLEEYPDIDAPQNWKDPHYLNLYGSLQPGWFTKIMRKFSFAPQPLWNPEDFAELLHAAVQSINKEKFREYVVGTAVSAEHAKKIYIFGALHGSLHSLLRCLGELIKQNVLNDNLELIVKDSNLVVLGSAINTGPYSLETLAVLFELYKKNPLTFKYLRGEQEEKLFWFNYSLREEIEQRCGERASDMLKDVQTYFESLPQGVYFALNQNTEILCLKGRALITGEELWEDYLQDFFKHLQPDKMTQTFVYDTKKNDRGILPRVIIESERQWSTFEPTNPLRIHFSDNPLCTIFSLASCPSRPYRYLYRLFFDAYACAELGGSLDKSLFTVFERDVRTTGSFFAKSYNLLTGRGFADTSLKSGASVS